MKKIPVLFCAKDSIYKKMGLDVYDEQRDALTWMGSEAAIYHPPCRLWSRMRGLSNADPLERYLALWAVNKVRSYGGILEHPKDSLLFPFMNLPLPGYADPYGFTIQIDQFNFGHRARKSTWLYICGTTPEKVLPLVDKKVPGKAKYYAAHNKRIDKPYLEKKERSATPRLMARTFVKIIQEINNSNNI